MRKLERARRIEEKIKREGQDMARDWMAEERARAAQIRRKQDAEKRQRKASLEHLDADVTIDIQRFTPDGALKRARIRRREEEEDMAAEKQLSLSGSNPDLKTLNNPLLSSPSIDSSTSSKSSSSQPASSSHPTPNWKLLNSAQFSCATDGVKNRLSIFFAGEVDETLMEFIQEQFAREPSKNDLVEELRPIFEAEVEQFVQELWNELAMIPAPSSQHSVSVDLD